MVAYAGIWQELLIAYKLTNLKMGVESPFPHTDRQTDRETRAEIAFISTLTCVISVQRRKLIDTGNMMRFEPSKPPPRT